jgi:hypothetical protein
MKLYLYKIIYIYIYKFIYKLNIEIYIIKKIYIIINK